MLKDLLQSPAILLKFIVSVLYTVMGVLFLVVKELIAGFTGPLAIGMGSVLLIYGIFRFYRAYMELKEFSRSNNQE